jgi:hypothetical protein
MNVHQPVLNMLLWLIQLTLTGPGRPQVHAHAVVLIKDQGTGVCDQSPSTMDFGAFLVIVGHRASLCLTDNELVEPKEDPSQQCRSMERTLQDLVM